MHPLPWPELSQEPPQRWASSLVTVTKGGEGKGSGLCPQGANNPVREPSHAPIKDS